MVRHDLAKQRPSRELLAQLIDEYGLATVMSTKSPTWKKMELDLATMTKKKAIDLMLAEPNLIKRPLLLVNGKAIFGYKRDQYDELLG